MSILEPIDAELRLFHLFIGPTQKRTLGSRWYPEIVRHINLQQLCLTSKKDEIRKTINTWSLRLHVFLQVRQKLK